VDIDWIGTDNPLPWGVAHTQDGMDATTDGGAKAAKKKAPAVKKISAKDQSFFKLAVTGKRFWNPQPPVPILCKEDPILLKYFNHTNRCWCSHGSLLS